MLIPVLLGIFSSFLFGLSAVIKKIILNNTVIKSFTLTVYATLIHSLIGTLLVIFFYEDIFNNPRIIFIIVLAGFIYGLSLYIYNYAIEKDEVSRATQLASLETVVTPMFAILLLGETLSKFEFVGIGLIILGVLILTIEKDVIKVIKTAKYAVLPIFIALILWGVEDVMLKYSLGFETIIFVYFWVRFSSFVTLLLIGLFVNDIKDNMIKFTQKMVNGKTEYSRNLYISLPIISGLGLLSTVTVYSLIELSIASPIVGSYPLFTILILYQVQKRYEIINVEDKEPIGKRLISGLLFISGIIVISVV